jgi:predicted HicB family RNase H-like nuclease
MSANEQPNNLPIELTLLEEKKKIVVLNSEHELILEHITNELKAPKYNSIVTMDNFNGMKESSNELGKTSKFISRFRIDKKTSEMEDINIFETNFKSYCTLIDAKQAEIKKGLEVFEAETRKQILEICTKYLVEQYKEQDLRVEFRIIDISDMTLSKYATKTMTIAKPGKDEIDKRINEKLALQNKVDLRLSNLENICLRAGIEPLTIEHIQGFLFEIDERYEIKLKVLIDAEIKRSEAVKARVEAETRKEVAEEQNQDPMPFIKNEAPQSQEVQERVNKLIENQKEVPVTTNEKVTKTISMQVNVKANIPDELVLKHIFGLIGNDVDKFIQMFKVS